MAERERQSEACGNESSLPQSFITDGDAYRQEQVAGIYLLASPCALQGPSWIKPGVVMFDWWAKHNIYGVDFKSGINTETAKYFIDFCADYGFRYFLFDDGWCPGDNILKPVPELDMEEVTSYAESKGIDLMLWVIWRTLERQWDEAFSMFELWGIKGIE